jgi:hypothetical protein
MDATSVLTVVVVIETIVLALLAVVVVSLLRSHAEVLRRLPAPDDEDQHEHGRSIVTLDRGALDAPAGPNTTAVPSYLPAPSGSVTQAHDIGGRTLHGDTVALTMALDRPTLVAFLSSGCLTCRTFWDGLRPEVRRPLPGDARLVVVVKDRDFESPAKLLELAPPDVLVVHSSAAWEEYGVTMSPYFCFVDGTNGSVRSEGAATSWEQVRSLLTDAIADEDLARREAELRTS